MVRPTANVLALLELLQSGRTHTAAELARRLDVDARTVRRYMDRLADLDVPVESTRGRYGGYRLARSFRLPPLMFNDDEAVAVVWALLSAARSSTGPASQLDIETATAKVCRVLPPALAQRIDAVVQTVTFTARAGEDGVAPPATGRRPHFSADVLLDLAHGAVHRRVVTFTYTPRHGRARTREVRPYAVVAHHETMYLSGHDVAHDAVRTFRLDRISDVHMRQDTFVPPPDIDPVLAVLGPLAPDPLRHEVSVRIRATVPHVRQFMPETLVSVQPLPDHADDTGWLRVFVSAERLEWVAARLAALDCPFVVETPDALRQVVAELGRRLIDMSELRSAN